MNFSKPQPDKPQFSLITIVFTNSTPFPFMDFNFQTAPPKYLRFVISPLSSTVLPPNGGNVSVMVKAANSAFGEKAMAMKMRITYVFNGVPVVIEEVVKNFPSGL